MRNFELEINKREKQIIEARNLLNDTDYKLLRELDGGEAMDAETKRMRKEARETINELEQEICALREEQESSEIEMFIYKEIC